MDFRKVFCHYHTTQHITNYCSQKDCNLPLCPNCIANHTQFHIKNKTHPKYQSIGQSLTRAQSTIDQQSSSFYDYKTKLVDLDLVSKKQNLIQNIIIRIEQTKRSILNHVEKLFQNIIKDNLSTVHNKQISTGLYSNQRLHELYDALNIQFDYLNQVKQKLRGQNHISHMINYFEKQCDSKSKILKDISRSIQFNQQYRVEIEVDKNLIKQIELLIKNKIQLRFTLPSQQNVNPLLLKSNSLSQKHSLINPSQTIMVKQKSQQDFQQRKLFNSTQQSFQRNSLQNSDKINTGLVRMNSTFYRPSSFHSKLSTMPNTQSIIFKKPIISSPKKPNKFIVSEINKNKQIENKQKRGLTLHKTINEITFR